MVDRVRILVAADLGAYAALRSRRSGGRCRHTCEGKLHRGALAQPITFDFIRFKKIPAATARRWANQR